MVRRTLLLAIVFLWLSGCKEINTADKIVSRAQFANLGKDEQNHREMQKIIANVHYDIELDLLQDAFFQGRTHLSFHLKEKKAIAVDLLKAQISDLIVNKNKVSIQYDGSRIRIDAADLAVGANSIEVAYHKTYAEATLGIKRYTDPVDKKTYLYSTFSEDSLSEVVPCFNYPDIKGTFASLIIAPKDWLVVSATPRPVIDYSSNKFYWKFSNSEPISPSGYSIYAGPYFIWEKNINIAGQAIPLRVLARQSMAKFVDIEDFFLATKNGLSYFQSKIKRPFPFAKHDQILVPDAFRININGASTVGLQEGIFSLKNSTNKYFERRNDNLVVLRELAKMWLGQLVTDSSGTGFFDEFVNYLSYQAMTYGTLFSDGSILALTEAINVSGRSLFFKQLELIVGQDEIYAWIGRLVDQFKYKVIDINTGFSQLKSPNHIVNLNYFLHFGQKKYGASVTYDCSSGKTKNVMVRFLESSHSFKDYPAKIKVAAFKHNGSRVSIYKVVEATINKNETPLIELEKLECSQLVFILPDYQFHFGVLKLDSALENKIGASLNSIDEESARLSYWASIWSKVRDGESSALEFLETFYNKSFDEKNDIVELNLVNVLTSIHQYIPSEMMDVKNLWIEKYSSLALEKLKSTEDPELKKIWFKFLLRIASDKKTLLVIEAWKKKVPPYLKGIWSPALNESIELRLLSQKNTADFFWRSSPPETWSYFLGSLDLSSGDVQKAFWIDLVKGFDAKMDQYGPNFFTTSLPIPCDLEVIESINKLLSTSKKILSKQARALQRHVVRGQECVQIRKHILTAAALKKKSHQ